MGINSVMAFFQTHNVERLDASASIGSDTTTYTVSAGVNRGLIVIYTQEDATPLLPTVTYGGESMVETEDLLDSTQRTTVFFLDNAGITAAVSTTITVSNSAASGKHLLAIASYQHVAQATPTNTDEHATTASLNIVTSAPGSAVFSISSSSTGSGNSASWGADLTEQEEIIAAANSMSFADSIDNVDADNVDCDCTWNSDPGVSIAVELARF